MREATLAFLGTMAAVLFCVGIVAWLAWRETQRLEQPKRPPQRDVDPDERAPDVAAPREAVHSNGVPS